MSVRKKMQHKEHERDTELDGNQEKTAKVDEKEALRQGEPADVDKDVNENGSAESDVPETDRTTDEAERIDELEEQVRQLQGENSELKDQYLRKQADFDNFRKRMQREKQDALKYANTNLLQDLITIIDDFERAIRSSEESKDFESFHSGIKMIEHQFISMLERKYGLKRMESEGQEFDPQMHEAINMEESPEVDTQMVVEDYQKGYLLNDRVLRHARVKVAVPAPSGAPSGAASGAADGKDDGEVKEEQG